MEGCVGVVAGSAWGGEIDITDNDFRERARPFVFTEPGSEGGSKSDERGSLGGGREIKSDDEAGLDPLVRARGGTCRQDANGITRDEGDGEEDRWSKGGVSDEGNTPFGRRWELRRGGVVVW